MEIRQATDSELESLMKVFDCAREIMRDSGNLRQS